MGVAPSELILAFESGLLIIAGFGVMAMTTVK
jgi:hypothetical protein